jgi:hypothetical protein
VGPDAPPARVCVQGRGWRGGRRGGGGPEAPPTRVWVPGRVGKRWRVVKAVGGPDALPGSRLRARRWRRGS